MKEFIGYIKKLWDNKRTRSIAILIIYFFFFLFVFSLISRGDKTNINSNDEFYYLNNVEIINYSVYDVDDNVIQEFDKELVSNNMMYRLVKNSTLESTNYMNNTNTYYISIIDYEKLINNMDVEIDGGIRITISDSNIVLDFTEYYGYKINIDIRS